MSKIIIVEGIDRVGKTTLIDKIIKELKYAKFIPANADLSYRGYPSLAKIIETEKSFATLATLAALEDTDYKIIFDRFHISEYVYGKVDRGYINLDCFHLDEVLAQLNALLIFVHPTDIDRSSREHGGSLNEHYEAFLEFIDGTKLQKLECNYDTIDETVETLRMLKY